MNNIQSICRKKNYSSNTEASMKFVGFIFFSHRLLMFSKKIVYTILYEINLKKNIDIIGNIKIMCMFN
jgi:hypothetical protein